MVSLKTKQRGFTIVELMIVIAVIGVLSLIVITQFTGIRQSARNKDRQNDIRILHTQLEAYYTNNSKYPTLANLNDTTWRSTNFKGVEDGTYQDPQGTSGNLVSTPVAKSYAYQPTPSGCDNTTTDCTGYTLTGTYEGTEDGQSTMVKKSLN